MLSVSARIWTRVAVSISNDDNHYTTGTSAMVDREKRGWVVSNLVEADKYFLSLPDVSVET